MPAPSKRIRDFSFRDLFTTGKGIALFLATIAAIVVFQVVFSAVTSEDEPDIEFTPYVNSVTCPDDYARAGQRIEYDEDEVLSTWDKVINDKMSEWRLARERVIEENCGEQKQPTPSPQEIEAERIRAEQEREQAARDQ